MKTTRVLVFTAALGSAAAVFAAQKLLPAENWLARVPPPPATAEAAYAQWTDTGGTLKPAPELEKIREGIKSQVLVLSRVSQPPPGGSGPLSRHDQVLIGRITAFPDTARVLQTIQAARTAQAGLIQKWNSELHTLEQRRLRDRGALPACHNVAGAPSQLAIRDVELAYVQEKISIAAQYLEQFKPVFQQMLAAVSPRIEHGDTVMEAWNGLRNPGAQAQFAAVARSAETDALLDVGLLQEFIQGVSKLAARPIADRNALGRVYAHAKGC